MSKRKALGGDASDKQFGAFPYVISSLERENRALKWKVKKIQEDKQSHYSRLKTMKSVLCRAKNLLSEEGYVMYNGQFYKTFEPYQECIEESALVPGIPTPQGVHIENHEDDDIDVQDYPLNEPWYVETIVSEGNTAKDIFQPDAADVGGYSIYYTDR